MPAQRMIELAEGRVKERSHSLHDAERSAT